MITLTKSGNAIVFTFDDNDHYLNDGKIEVPVNSLTLVTDESQMATFKRSSTNDIFISARYDELGMSKSDLESWFKENACGSTGGGGVTEEEVQDMIDESTSGLAESSAVTEEISAAVSGKADTSAVTASINAAVSGKMDTSAFNTYSASTDARISEDEEVTSAALNALDDALDDKADTTAVTASIAAAVSGKQDTLIAGTNIKTVNNESLLGSGNIDIQGGGKAIVAGTNISVTTGETADTINCTLPITAGTNNGIIIGDSECSASGSYSLAIGHNSDANAMYSIVVGSNSAANGSTNFVYGNNCKTTTSNSRLTFIFGDHIETSKQFTSAFGRYLNIKNDYEHSFGQYNNSVSGSSTFGDSGNTLFSVGNGTGGNARHNAFEIRQNGDIYITKDGSDVKLQDQLGGGGLPESAFTAYTAATEARLAEDEEVTAAALTTLNTATAANTTALGGLKLVQLTQAAYDALVSGGTVDASTLYLITNSN